MNGDIEQLTLKRRKWVEANRENNFESGIKRLLTELYPEDAHFIYELLQNAEDARATKVSFILGSERFEFEHNGSRLFSFADVDAITSIGVSTKRDDPTSIGKFGVGFKAVFAYTNTPEIHSGEFHFRIHDLVVPETNGVKKPRMSERETRFFFPFDHPKKSSKQALAQIGQGLRALGDNTLLFLSHIRIIEYLLPDGSLGSLERIDHEGGRIEIRASHPGIDVTVSHWLRFQKDVEVIDEGGKPKNCRVAIAYNLVEGEGKKKLRSMWKIVPLDHGQVSIYFPAEKETSNLRFHIHAPFASTVARDGVRDCEANHHLRDQLATLVVESLSAIRDRGMLTVGFLAALPNPEDNLFPFYEPIRKAIVHAFQNEPLTPTRSGAHAKADGLYRGPARIAEVLNDDDLSLLTDDAPPLWAANPPQQNQREDRFLDSLGIAEWGWSELVHAINWLDEEKRKRVENWIARKDDASLMRFYALLGEACVEHSEYLYVSNLRIVRVKADKGDEHVIPKNVFFSPDEELTPPQDIRFVKPTVYSAGRSEAQKKSANSFLEKIGVRPFDAKAVIELRLARYKSPPKQVEDAYFKDLKQFIAYWKKNPTDAGLFSGQLFLLGVSHDGGLYWRKPEKLCLDSPYLETGFAELAIIHGKDKVWNGYQDKLSKSQLKDLIDFLKAIDVMYALNVELVDTDHNPHARELRQDYGYRTRWTDNATNKDYTISNIDKYIAAQAVSASRLIWDALIRADPESAKARFRPNNAYPTREAESQLVYHLKCHAWIPDKSGAFRKPQEITRDELRNDFPYDDRNGLLTAIGFGENAMKRNEKYQVRSQQAHNMGFDSPDEAEKMAEIAKLLRENGKSPDELILQLRPDVSREKPASPTGASKNPLDFPSELENALNRPGETTLKGEHESDNSPVRNPDRRREKEAETHKDMIENEPSSTERRRRIERTILEGPDEQVRKTLEEWYAGKCQICCHTFPQRDGRPFFIAKYMVPRKLARQVDSYANALCLCAEHFARWQHGAAEADNIIDQIRTIKLKSEGGNGNFQLRVKLCGEECVITFNEKHVIALQELLNITGKDYSPNLQREYDL